jgi:hypothetical protein
MEPSILQSIEAIAPNQAQRCAPASQLGVRSALSENGAGLIWGVCYGSSASPYRAVVADRVPVTCILCPSRKVPLQT